MVLPLLLAGLKPASGVRKVAAASSCPGVGSRAGGRGREG